MERLREALGLGQSTALVIGIIIGASIFVQPSEIMRDVPSIAGFFVDGRGPASSPWPVR